MSREGLKSAGLVPTCGFCWRWLVAEVAVAGGLWFSGRHLATALLFISHLGEARSGWGEGCSGNTLAGMRTQVRPQDTCKRLSVVLHTCDPSAEEVEIVGERGVPQPHQVSELRQKARDPISGNTLASD